MINPVIYAEVSIRFKTIEKLEDALPKGMFERRDILWEAAFLAGKCFVKYRRADGTRAAPLPDFFITGFLIIDFITAHKGIYCICQSSLPDSCLRLFSVSFDLAFQKHLYEGDELMAMNSTVYLRYIGVIPQTECLEYGFRIEDKDKDSRVVVMMIESDFFKRYKLMFQEAPDLCYQKLLADLGNETADLPINPRLSVTAADIAHYRELHPIGRSPKLRRGSLPL